MVHQLERPIAEQPDPDLEALTLRATDANDVVARPAFQQLCERYANMVRRRALGMVKRAELADEIQQQTFLKAWEKRTTFTGGSFASWLYVIAGHLAVDHLRKPIEKRTQSLETLQATGQFQAVDQLSVEQPDLLATKELVTKALQILAEQIPERGYKILSDYFLKQKSRQDIAQEWELDINLVDTILHRGRLKLKAILQDLTIKQTETQPITLENITAKQQKTLLESQIRIEAALDKLPNKQIAQILHWHIIDGLPDLEIATKIGKSRDAVASLLKRQRRLLAEELGGTIPDLHSVTPRLDAVLGDKLALEQLIQKIDNVDTVQVLRRHLIEGLSGRQIALETGEKENTVQVRIMRGKDKLEALLARPTSAGYSA